MAKNHKQMQAGVKERYDRFVANLFNCGFNGSEAVRQTPGYSDKYARTTARRLSTISYIRERIKAKQAELAAKSEISRENQLVKLNEAFNLAKDCKNSTGMVSAIREQNEMLGYHRESAPNLEKEEARRKFKEDERTELNRIARLRTSELSNEN